MQAFSLDWCNLQWSPWFNFREPKPVHPFLNVPGIVYRVRPVGINKLAYIGQSGRSARERVVRELIKHTFVEEMPFNDPHTAAPSVWAWHGVSRSHC